MNAEVELIAAVLQRDSIPSRVAARSAPLGPRPHPWLTRLRRALQRWWQRLWMDEMTAYLSEATSHVDLEHRIRAWDAAERRGRGLVPYI